MKSSIVLKPKVFTPITIDITLENEYEFEIFLKTMSRDIQVPKELYTTSVLNYQEKVLLERMMSDIHDTLVEAKNL